MQTDRGAYSGVQRISPFLAWALGTFIFFHKTLLSGFQWIQGDSGDTRLINFILEHGFRWLCQAPPHCSFFDPPVFYPQTNVGAYTDLLLGVAPLYWVWRLAGFQPDTAHQLWMIALSTLNFLAAYFLLKRFLSCGRIGSSIGALLFAFGTAQYAKMVHQQLTSQFFMVIVLMVLLTLFNRGDSAPSHRVRCASIFVLALAWTTQFYTSFYTFFFLGLVFVSALGWALVIRNWRGQVLWLLRTHYLCIGFAVILALLLLLPALSHYLSTLHDVGSRALRPRILARIYSWFLTGENNLMYGWILKGPLKSLPGSQFWGIGYLTFGIAGAGLLTQYKRASVRVLILATLTTAFLTTHLTFELGLWPYVREIIPGAQALREVGRVAMVQLIPTAIGLGFFFQRLATRRRWIPLLLLGGVCVLEQVNIDSGYISKDGARTDIASIAEMVDTDCDAFLLVSNRDMGYIPEFASWTTLATGKPTVNGRYGNFPPGYPTPLRRAQKFPGSIDGALIQTSLEEWCKSHGLLRERIQLLEIERYQGKLRAD